MNIDIRDRNTQIGIGLLVVGLLALFGNLGWFVGIGRLVGLALFLAAGAVVLRMYDDDPGKIWTLPVGFGLLGLGLATLDMPWSGGAFLGSLGLGFVAIFLTDRQRWWAIIPGGVLLTLGLTTTYEEWLPGGDGGTIFFLGLAATFAVLYLLPSVNQRWAIWPALALAVVGVLTMSFRGGWALPIILIIVGAWMLSRQSRPSEIPSSGPSRTSTGSGEGNGDGGRGSAGAGEAAGGDAARGADSFGDGRTTYGDTTSPVEPAVRTPAQTPGTAAVQPSQRPETPDQAARRYAEEADAPENVASDAVADRGEPVDYTDAGIEDGTRTDARSRADSRPADAEGEDERRG